MHLTVFPRAPSSRSLSGRGFAALLVAAFASPVLAIAALPAATEADRTPIAILYPPWTSAKDALQLSLSAGHRVLRTGRAAFIVVAAPPEPGLAPAGLPRGAWLALALSGLVGCLDAPATDRSAS